MVRIVRLRQREATSDGDSTAVIPDGDAGGIGVGIDICVLPSDCKDAGGSSKDSGGKDAKTINDDDKSPKNEGKNNETGDEVGGGRSEAVVIGDDGDDGGLGLGICVIVASCGDVASGSDGESAKAQVSPGGEAVAIGGEGGDGGLGLGICVIVASCENAGSGVASGGDGGDAKVISA